MKFLVLTARVSLKEDRNYAQSLISTDKIFHLRGHVKLDRQQTMLPNPMTTVLWFRHVLFFVLTESIGRHQSRTLRASIFDTFNAFS